ncbi:peroxiredoxin family protein [Labedaea rhizosphaerae]|uniref:Cytochrome c domain-containing protein n=1 Tax=Labedaea rhizosphaerae TaxID=598644 RepID=A0A4R6SIX8_LABRH|nr:TlpA family protein disulfide reductase [Labedaea rhizosphaerae]TDQ00869.1 hypothetical protein EV186_102735 [Labedaea rhizosphaerae]
MPVLVAAVVLLSLLCLLNLLLTVGILRRMRAGTQSTGPSTGQPTDLPFELKPGGSIDTFTATTTAGEELTADALAGTVAFFSADCDACHDMLPSFISYAASHGRDKVLAVVGGTDPQTVAALEPVARVIAADPDGGPVARAFRNTWTPAMYVIADRTVVATAGRVDELPKPALSGR